MSIIRISVIIPIFNAESYLLKCLNSIQNQSFEDYEVLLINDGSTDMSGKMCDDFATHHNKFRTIHKINGGVSSARNVGINHATGEWICFIDSDDTVDKDYLYELYRATLNQKECLIVQGFKTHIDKNKTFKREFKNKLYTSSTIYKTFKDLNINRCGFPFAKLYNNHIIQQNNIRFIENIHYAEDVMFMLTYMCYIKNILTINGANYNYFIRNNPNSLSKKIFSFESEYSCYNIYLERIEFLKEKFNIPEIALYNVYNVISEYLVRRAIGAMYQYQTRKPKSERIHILKSINQKQIDFLNLYYKQCSWFHKITTFLLKKHLYYFCDYFNCIIAFGRNFSKTNKL